MNPNTDVTQLKIFFKSTFTQTVEGRDIFMTQNFLATHRNMV
jgi:hypothetical protein